MNIGFICLRHARQAALAVAALPFYVGIAHAQANAAPQAPRSSTPSTASPLPAEATKGVRAPHRSALEGYQPYTEEKIIDWKEANDSTGRIGGWREYARQAQQPEAADAGAQPAPDVKPVKP